MIIFMDFYNMDYVVFNKVFTIAFETPDESSEAHRPTSLVEKIFANFHSNFFAGIADF